MWPMSLESFAIGYILLIRYGVKLFNDAVLTGIGRMRLDSGRTSSLREWGLGNRCRRRHYGNADEDAEIVDMRESE
jgi:hypothetical protein